MNDVDNDRLKDIPPIDEFLRLIDTSIALDDTPQQKALETALNELDKAIAADDQ
jgi:hypothetical protein